MSAGYLPAFSLTEKHLEIFHRVRVAPYSLLLLNCSFLSPSYYQTVFCLYQGKKSVCIVDGFFGEFYINLIGLSGTLPFSEDKLLFFQYCQSSFNRHLAFMENFCQCFNCKVNEHMTIDI